MKPSRARIAAEYGIITALAMILSYVEAMIPAFFAVPGMKLGLTNVIVIAVLYLKGGRSAMLVNLLRIFLVSVLFSNGVSFLYSLAGGMLSCAVMILLRRCFGIIAVSICGGISHNIGQILVAMALTETSAIAWYLAVLWFTGIATGAVVGLMGAGLINRTEKYVKAGSK